MFCYAGHFRKCRRHEPCRGVCILLQKISIFGGSQTAIFSTCREICLRKIDLEYENGKQLQVTIIKITESKENKSIHRLDVSSSKGPGGQLRPPCPPLAMSLTYLALTKRPSSFWRPHTRGMVANCPGGRVLPYMGYLGMCRCEGYGFQAVYSRKGYINLSVWV